MRSIGEVAKRSNATDCKSVAPVASKVRILPSPPLDSPLRGSLVAGRVPDRSSVLSEARRAESKDMFEYVVSFGWGETGARRE